MIRWFVDHPQDHLRTGGPVEYPDEATAREHAGNAGAVLALVPAEYVRVVEAARAWWVAEESHRFSPALLDDTELALGTAVDALPPCDRPDPALDPDAQCVRCGRRGDEHPAWRTT